jgi:SAM-dependent methyltransferase
MRDTAAKEPFGDYAAIYERIGQGSFGAQMATRTLERLAAPAGQSLQILDLACGTGAASFVFASAGHRVLGIDRSPAMLAIARQNAQEAGLAISYLQQDLRELQLDQLPEQHPFDLVTCFGHGLNYLCAERELDQLCRQLGPLLRPEGWFIFDLQTVKAFEDWNDRVEVIYDDEDLIVYNRQNYNIDEQCASEQLVWFSEQGERWWRFEESHSLRSWSDQQVTQALEAGGMHVLERRKPEGQLSDPESLRVVYYAQRSTEPKSLVTKE